MTLEEAIQKARVVWNHAKRGSTSTDKVASYWKYGAKSSGWRLAVSTLKQFGLMESVGSKKSGEVKLTELAIKIILDVQEHSPARDALIKVVALKPPIYQEVWSHWDGKLPPYDTLRTYLTINKGFNDASVSGFVADFQKTISFAKLTPADTIPPPGEAADDDDGEDEPDPGEQQRQPRRRPMQPGIKEDVFTLEEGPVVIQYPERLSPESFEDFESWLQLVIRKAKRSVQQDRQSDTQSSRAPQAVIDYVNSGQS
jgi:hypothetical protein